MRDVADAFHRAVTARDGRRGCALLAPTTVSEHRQPVVASREVSFTPESERVAG